MKTKLLQTPKVCFVCSRVSVRILDVYRDTYDKGLPFDDFDCFRLVTDFSHRVQLYSMSACLSEFLMHIEMRTVKVIPLLRNAGQPDLANFKSSPV